MTIAQLCQRKLITIDAFASPRAAANLMRENHIGSLVVMNTAAQPRAIGVVTDRDLAIEVVARGLDADTLHIGQLARGALIEVPATATMQEALEAMERGGVRRVLVVASDGAPVGIVSTDDVLGSIADQLHGLSTALRCGMAREKVERAPVAAAHPHKAPLGIPAGVTALQ